MLLVDFAAHSTAAEIIAGIVMLAVVLRVGDVVRYIPNDQVGIIEKLWSDGGRWRCLIATGSVSRSATMGGGARR